MSFLDRLMGGAPKKSEPKEDTSMAIQKIQGFMDLLEKKHDSLEKKIKEAETKAKGYGRASQKKALFHMRQRARYMKQQEDIMRQRETLDAQVAALEMIGSQQVTFAATKVAQKQLAQNKPDADQVADVMDEVAEGLDQAEEINDALSTPLGPQFDEMELLGDLDALQAGDLQESLGDLSVSGVSEPAAMELPDAPDSAIDARAKQQQEEERELAALEASWN